MLNIEASPLTLAGVPALAFWRGTPEEAAARGVVLFLHGFTANKECNAKELRRLAQSGILAVGLDAVGHGARRYPDFAERFPPGRSEGFLQALEEVIEKTATEIPAVVDDLERHRLYAGKLGLCGVSMGGYAAFGALLVEPRVGAAVTIVASPVWPRGGERSPHLRPEALGRVALLMQTAEKDSSVPAGEARAFHERLRQLHPTAKHAYVEVAGSDHLMNAADWARVVDRTVAWFARHLVLG